MAIELEGGCRVFRIQDGEPLRRGALGVWRQVGRENGTKAISLSALRLAGGSSAAWRNADCDEVLFVVEGEGNVVLGGRRLPIGPRAGVFVRPNETVAVEDPGAAPLALLDSRCPDPGPQFHFAEPGPSLSESARRDLSPVVRFEGQPTERAGDGRWFRVLVDAKAGCEQTTQFVGFIPPGRSPEHFHEYEEVVCILSGHGRFWSGAASHPISAGTGLYLPRRQPHCLENTGSEPLQLYGLFHPSGSPAVRYHPGGSAPPS
ncbi:MAG TPA: cupin domain-containing protein [Thermoanaerobaculia bacterium]|nr:cupin domain-containing protein [Thermoanaerobaculia bacterium]